MAEFGTNVALGTVSNTQLTTEDIPELNDETLSLISPTMNDSFEEFRHQHTDEFLSVFTSLSVF